MNVLITGAKGFVGKNLVCALYNVKTGKDRTRGVDIGDIYEYDLDTDASLLEEYCKNADFVFNLAGVNRPKDPSEFMRGNFGFASELLDTLKACENRCPVMLSSSIQATLAGRYADSEYGRSKLSGEELFFDYSAETGATVYVYRFVNLFGKWSRPNYNSVVATFCHNIANGLPIRVDDRAGEIELSYIDDVIDEMILALKGEPHRCEFEGREAKPTLNGKYCHVPVTHATTLGEIVDLLESFRLQPETLFITEIPKGSFAKKLYSTYLSYLPAEKAIYPLKMNVDDRGSFTEIIKTLNSGQFSVNISKPGITKGQHWHDSKWELFIVVSGRALISERNIATGETMNFEVSGEKIEAVHMLPGYTHSIENLSDTSDLVTFMWANEVFDPQKPDTFFERV